MLKIGQTVKINSKIIAGARNNHAFHWCLLSTILFHLVYINSFFCFFIKNKRFVLSTYISRTSQIFNESVKQYFLGLDKKSREDFITILWELVSSTNAKTIPELKKDIPKQLLKVYDSYKLLDDNEKTLFKRHVLYIVKLFIHSIRYFENYKEEVPLNDIKNLYDLF